MMKSITKNSRFPQNGFSLIEIMVALALGAIILLGVAEIFTNNSQTRAEIERTGQQIESGSYALGLIESDLTNAAFWGEAGEQPADPALPLPEVCVGLDGNAAVAASKLVEAMGYPLQGEGAAGCISPKAGTDFIAVRRVASCAYGSPGCDSVDPNFYLQVNACFNASDSSAPLPGVDLRISEDHSVHDYTQRDCSTSAPEYRVLSRIYYVDDCPPPYDPDRPPPPPCLSG